MGGWRGHRFSILLARGPPFGRTVSCSTWPLRRLVALRTPGSVALTRASAGTAPLGRAAAPPSRSRHSPPHPPRTRAATAPRWPRSPTPPSLSSCLCAKCSLRLQGRGDQRGAAPSAMPRRRTGGVASEGVDVAVQVAVADPVQRLRAGSEARGARTLHRRVHLAVDARRCEAVRVSESARQSETRAGWGGVAAGLPFAYLTSSTTRHEQPSVPSGRPAAHSPSIGVLNQWPGPASMPYQLAPPP